MPGFPSDDTPQSEPRESPSPNGDRARDGATAIRESAEDAERTAAWKRGRERDHASARESARAEAKRSRAVAAAEAFTAFAENVRDYAIFLMNCDGVITFWGEGARLIEWWTREEAEGSHLRLLYPSGGSEDGSAEMHLKAAAERGEYTGEGHRMRSDGSLFWAGITLTALRDEYGTLLGFAKLTRDLTARRAADALLQSAAASAESAIADAVAASAAKSSFLATMSHEIRTPVNAIIGYLELLNIETDGPLTPGQRRHLERASASSRHLLSLITEVLDFSRIDAERAVVHREVFRIGDAVTAAVGLVSPQAQQRGLELAEAVSGYAAGLAVSGDETRVRQILVNLLANSVKFTSPRTGRKGRTEPGRITISAGTAAQASPDAQLSGPGPWVYVRVEDTGVGIPADRLQAVFEPFVQADMKLTRTHGGTGLGLAISRRLARMMDGDVTGRSEEGVGSTFFLWLPAAPLESLETGGVEGHGPGSGAASGKRTDAELAGEHVPHPLRGVSDAIIGDLERLLHAYVTRLRSDPATPSAHKTSRAEVEDQLASFLADLAATLRQLTTIGDTTSEELDASEIQRLVSERHGIQRARLGWKEDELRHEFMILKDELTATIRQLAPGRTRGPGKKSRETQVQRALEVVHQFLQIAERESVNSYRHARNGAGVAAL